MQIRVVAMAPAAAAPVPHSLRWLLLAFVSGGQYLSLSLSTYLPVYPLRAFFFTPQQSSFISLV